jgi:hypothetical protein
VAEGGWFTVNKEPRYCNHCGGVADNIDHPNACGCTTWTRRDSFELKALAKRFDVEAEKAEVEATEAE